MTTDEKCREIIQKIVERCDEGQLGVNFTPDWGGNSLSVGTNDGWHTHVGDPDETFENLVDSLYALLTSGIGEKP